MNEIYEKYNALSKEHEEILNEVAVMRMRINELTEEAKEADQLRRGNAEAHALVKRQRSEIEMLKECIIKMELERQGVN